MSTEYTLPRTSKPVQMQPGQRVILKLPNPVTGIADPIMGVIADVKGQQATVTLLGDFRDPITGKLYPKGFQTKPLVTQLVLPN